MINILAVLSGQLDVQNRTYQLIQIDELYSVPIHDWAEISR